MEKLLKNISQNNMKGYYIKDRKELLVLLEALIPPGSTVGCGDSVTLEETGVFEFLRNGNYLFYDKHNKNLTKAEKQELYIKNFSCHTFITGSNALTMDGGIFNIDGNGSRVAPMIYGPKQVIVVVGINKVTYTLEEAIKRTRNIAAPLDAKRLGKSTPCVKLGKCVDCKSLDRICNDFVLIARQFIKGRIKIIIMDQTLGY